MMLRLRIARGRLSLPRTRLASTATSPSPTPYSSTAPPPAPLSPLRPRSALYSQPTLPPLAAPLPVDGIFYSAPGLAPPAREAPIHEQLAVLDACLNSGEIVRAEEVASRICAAWARQKNLFKKQIGPDPGPLSNLLPPRVHADFLRSYLARAAQVDDEQDKITWVGKAWTYWDTLDDALWWVQSPRSPKKFNAAIDPDVLAILLKGLVALGPEYYNPGVASPPRLRKVTTVLGALTSCDIPLGKVLRSTIFDLDQLLGPVSREMTMQAIEDTGKGGQVFREWESQITSLRDEVRQEHERELEQIKAISALKLNPTRSVVGSSQTLMPFPADPESIP